MTQENTPRPSVIDLLRAGVVTCARCGAEADPRLNWTCWWCCRHLCPECWRDPGHCGHDEADEVVRRLAERQLVLGGRWFAGGFTLWETADLAGYSVGHLKTIRQLYGFGRFTKGPGGRRRLTFSGHDVLRLQQLRAAARGQLPDWAEVLRLANGERLAALRATWREGQQRQRRRKPELAASGSLTGGKGNGARE